MKLLFFITFFLVVSGAYARNPVMPADASSKEAYLEIKNYFQIQEGLPEALLEATEIKSESNYNLLNLRLKLENEQSLQLVLKIPKVFRPPLAAVVLFTGFQTGSEVVNLVGDPKDCIYVGFQYPWPIQSDQGKLIWNWERMQKIPLLMATAMKWLYQQPYVDRDKINVVNVSFGTLFFPLAQRFLNDENLFPHSIVFAYGGVDIPEVIVGELFKNKGLLEITLAKNFIRTETWFVEPKYHLPHLHGPFLVVNGESDTVFPEISKQGLFDGLVEPKTLVTLPGGHIQPDKKELISLFLTEVEKFLRETHSL